MGRSDSSCPFIDGVDSTPSRRGPAQPKAARPGLRSPRFRRSPFVRDKVSDLGGASAPRMSVPHILPSTISKASASTISYLSRLNRSPHTIAVYASQRSSPSATQHSLPGGRYPLPGPDFHRLDHASFAWRTDIDIEPSSPSGKLSRNLLCDVTLFDRHVIPTTAEIQGQPASTFVRARIPAFAGATGNWLEPLPGPALPPSTARARSRRRPRCCSRGGSPLA